MNQLLLCWSINRNAIKCIFAISGFLAFAGSVAHAERAMPVASGNAYTLTTGPLVLTVGTGNGGRVTSLKHAGKEMLFTQVQGSLLWGSTLWASPQMYWTAGCKSARNMNCFPPPAAHDPNPYTATLLAADTAVTLTGGADAYTSLRFRKTFSADLSDTSITARYHLINTGNAPISWAPWETTRFPSGGWAFWPTGQGERTGDASMNARMRDTLGVTWFPFDSSKAPSSNPKTFADAGAGGWLARVDKDRVVFIKKFQDTPLAQKAPEGENEVELYIQRELLELELQGPYGPIPVGDSVAWEVKWYARPLPDGVPVGPNAALLAFVEQTVAERTVGLGEGARRANGGLVGPAGRGPLASAFVDPISATVTLELRRSADLTVDLRDLNGRVRSSLAEGALEAGRHRFSLPSGGAGRWLVVTERREDGGSRTVLRRPLASLRAP